MVRHYSVDGANAGKEVVSLGLTEPNGVRRCWVGPGANGRVDSLLHAEKWKYGKMKG